ALVDGNWPAVWPRLGLASAFHVLVGGWSTLAVFLVWLTQSHTERPALKRMAPPLLLGGVLALPGVVPAMQLTYGIDASTTSEANRIYVFDRIPHHLALLKLPLAELIEKAVRYEVLLSVFVLLWLFCRRQIKKSPSRVSDARKLDRLFSFAAGSLVFTAIALLWHVIFWNQPLVAAKLLKYYLFRLGDIALPLTVSLAIGWLINLLIQRQSKWAIVLLVLAIALPSWHLLAVSSSRYANPRPPADRRVKNLAAWQDACTWAREQTPLESLFMIPRGAQSFNWNAERPDLVNWKEVPQDAAALLIWRKRFFEVFYGVDETGQRVAFHSLAEQGAERIRGLAKKYNVDYVLTEEYPPLDLPVAYSNAYYTIYAVE
ncbi:MAG: hypothetical protein MI725_17250, partial [Pirellulales bacterium]|nr:hypothetical protein [Pirellulales bacterium]